MRCLARYITIAICILSAHKSCGQPFASCYHESYNELCSMLACRQPQNFKRAVFLVENAYYDNKNSYNDFCEVIAQYKDLCLQISHSKQLSYTQEDSLSVRKHAAIYTFMVDSVPYIDRDGSVYYSVPFTYNFDDFSGTESWDNMFITKLMQTCKGNCHSLPMLYKLIAEEMGEQAWLALAPNHMYIKLRNKQSGWYNTELTSGDFPVDAWLMASGYIHLDAVRSGIYMDTLSQRQSIALCLVDLAQGYQKKYSSSDGNFVRQCCSKALKYYPNCINALLLQAEATMQAYQHRQDNALLSQAEAMYAQIHALGYRKMPAQMYLSWLSSLQRHKERYHNKNLVFFNNSNMQ